MCFISFMDVILISLVEGALLVAIVWSLLEIVF